MISHQISVPLFIKIANNAFQNFFVYLKEYKIKAKKIVVVADKIFLPLAKKISLHVLVVGDNSLTLAEEIAKRVKKYDLLVAIGGGRALDVGKYVATKAKINYINVPTTVSNDGICSPIAVLKNKKGLTESLGVKMPLGIILDLKIIRTSPLDNIRAGVGDLISNFSALKDWKLASEEKKEKWDDFAALLSFTGTDFFFSKYKNKKRINLRDEEFLRTLVDGLVLSGLSMDIAGTSRPCSGGEHEISHAIDQLFPGSALHGQQVAVATLLCEKLRHNDYKEYTKFFKLIGLPTKYQELGLTRQQMIKALVYAPKTRPGRFTILEKVKINQKIAKKIL